MGDVVIRVEGLGKKYRIRHERVERYTALRDVIADKVRGMFSNLSNPFDTLPALGADVSEAKFDFLSKARPPDAPSVEDFWALRDVSFEVKRGEVVGIIGRNGAGKSTLLKILSRITEPTEGRVELDGRVASLLEVGTGFHPELTGRENIFLNGAILGMTRVEIRRKFDEIVAFAEVEKFLDTPVKRYSSGMYVRLAFSVAAHLESEILVVDEVLAVGDAEFQKKCLGKMHEVSKGGRTVLFVSHNMAAVQALCGKAVYLHAGGVRGMGDVGHWVAKYLGEAQARVGQRSDGPVRIDDCLTLELCELTPNPAESGSSVRFRIVVAARKPVRLSDAALLLHTQQGVRVGILDFRPSGLPVTLDPDRSWELCGEIRNLPLVEGEYSAGLYLSAGDFDDNLLDLVALSVGPRTPADGLIPYPAEYRGVLNFDFNVGAGRPVTS